MHHVYTSFLSVMIRSASKIDSFPDMETLNTLILKESFGLWLLSANLCSKIVEDTKNL